MKGWISATICWLCIILMICSILSIVKDRSCLSKPWSIELPRCSKHYDYFVAGDDLLGPSTSSVADPTNPITEPVLKVTCFITHWCPFSNSMFAAARSAVSELEAAVNIEFNVINCDEIPEATYQYGISKVPTLQIASADWYTEYPGAYTSDAISNFILFFRKAYGKSDMS